MLVLLAAAALTLAACSSATQTAFERTTSEAGSTLAAAAVSLRYAHRDDLPAAHVAESSDDGNLTDAYAEGAFVNYEEKLEGLDEELPSLQGHPSDAKVKELVELYHAAKPALANPCLQKSCGWEAQASALERAAKAFSDASGG